MVVHRITLCEVRVQPWMAVCLSRQALFWFYFTFYVLFNSHCITCILIGVYLCISVSTNCNPAHTCAALFNSVQPWTWLRNLTAVPRSTQPSSIWRMVKWVSTVLTVGENTVSLQTDSRPSQLAWSNGWQPLDAVLHPLSKLYSLLQWLCYDNSTINIVLTMIALFRVTSCCC